MKVYVVLSGLEENVFCGNKKISEVNKTKRRLFQALVLFFVRDQDVWLTVRGLINIIEQTKQVERGEILVIIVLHFSSRKLRIFITNEVKHLVI